MKKILFSLTLFITTAFSADPNLACKTSLDGLSIGVHGGYITGDHSTNVTIVNAATTDAIHLSSHGSIGGLNMGYGHIFSNKFYAGVEGHASLTHLNGKNKYFTQMETTLTKMRLEMKHSEGVALKLGRVVWGALPYVKVEGNNGRFESSIESLMLGKQKVKKNRAGFEIGFGADFPVNSRVVLGGEFSHGEYKKISYDVVNNFGQVTEKVRVKPKTNHALLRLRIKLF